MNRKKATPYIFIVTLLLIIVFMGGIKYGIRVEKINKTEVLSLTPIKKQASPTPIIEKPTLKTLAHPGCKVSFIYPYTSSTIIKKATHSATITDKMQKLKVELDCKKEDINEIQKKLSKDYTKTKTIIHSGVVVEKYTSNKKINILLVRNKLDNSRTVILASDNILPFIESSIQIYKP